MVSGIRNASAQNFGPSDQRFSNLAFSTLFEGKNQLEGKLGTKINFLDYLNLKQIATKSAILSNGRMKNLNDVEMPHYFCKIIHELFYSKNKGSQRFRKIFKYDKYVPPQFDSEKWEKYSKLNYVRGMKLKFSNLYKIHTYQGTYWMSKQEFY